MKCNTCINYIRSKKTSEGILKIVRECKFGLQIDIVDYYRHSKNYKCIFYERFKKEMIKISSLFILWLCSNLYYVII